jgi:hypothetical protein
VTKIGIYDRMKAAQEFIDAMRNAPISGCTNSWIDASVADVVGALLAAGWRAPGDVNLPPAVMDWFREVEEARLWVAREEDRRFNAAAEDYD